MTNSQEVPLKAIETEREYDHTVAATGKLIGKGEANLSPEKSAPLEAMSILIAAHDERHCELPELPPRDMLAYLMEENGLKPTDLLPVFGTRGLVSEVLSGTRAISK